MSPALEKISKDFDTLTLQEKIHFLGKVISLPPGELILLDGQLHFIPEGSPPTDEEERSFSKADDEIEAGQGVTLDELRQKYEI